MLGWRHCFLGIYQYSGNLMCIAQHHLSLIVRKPTFCICQNRGADQLCSNCEADQRLCFLYIASTIPLLYKSKISSLQPSSVLVQLGLCQTCSETNWSNLIRICLINETSHSLFFCFIFLQFSSLCVRKLLTIWVSDQVRHKLAFTVHYENMPMQNTVIFKIVKKNENFQ